MNKCCTLKWYDYSANICSESTCTNKVETQFCRLELTTTKANRAWQQLTAKAR